MASGEKPFITADRCRSLTIPCNTQPMYPGCHDHDISSMNSLLCACSLQGLKHEFGIAAQGLAVQYACSCLGHSKLNSSALRVILSTSNMTAETNLPRVFVFFIFQYWKMPCSPNE